jgi:uncharacterized protein
VPVQGFPDMDQLLRDMDAASVAKAVLLGWYWETHASCVTQNRFYAECVRAHPDRLAGFATVQPAAGAVAFEEAVRALDEGLIGLGELSPHSQHVGPHDPIWRKLLTLATERGVPVNLHVTDPASKTYPGRVGTPLEDFLRLAREFPATQFILAHWGGGLAWSADAIALPNVWFDTAASPLLYGPEIWKKSPSERVLFGSDYPLVLYPQTETEPSMGSLLAEARKQQVSLATFGANTARLLNR